MRFEEYHPLAEEVAWLSRQPLPISLMRWNDFLAALDQALLDAYARGVDAAPTLAARAAVDSPSQDLPERTSE